MERFTGRMIRLISCIGYWVDFCTFRELMCNFEFRCVEICWFRKIEQIDWADAKLSRI